MPPTSLAELEHEQEHEHEEAPAPSSVPFAGLVDELAAARRAAAERLVAEGARARRFGRLAWSRLTSQEAPWWQQPTEPLPRRVARIVQGSLSPGAPGTPGAPGVGEGVVRWRRALLMGLGAFALWALLDAPTLLHSAEGSPLGTRRTAAMTVLRPLAAASRDLGLSNVVGAADRVLGRQGPGVVQVVKPVPTRRPEETQALHPPGAPAPAPAPARSATDTLSPFPAPTAADPLRVLTVGDSLGVDFGGPFAEDLAATGVVAAEVDAQVDTGLARPDYFDWPAELQADVAKYHPQAVVVFLGANDPQNMVVGGQALTFGTPAWDQAYAERVGQFMSEATAAGARVMWVGMPPMADPGRNAAMARVDDLYQQQAAVHPGVTYLSSWTVLGDAQGNFAEYLPAASGAPVDVREPDGTHISPAGAERLSQSVITAMDHAWGLTLAP